jgi:hypothetical protein
VIPTHQQVNHLVCQQRPQLVTPLGNLLASLPEVRPDSRLGSPHVSLRANQRIQLDNLLVSRHRNLLQSHQLNRRGNHHPVHREDPLANQLLSLQ